MKNLVLLAIGTALLVSSSAGARKEKSKHKEKSFEPVAAADAGGYRGHYVGIESSHWVDVQVGPENRLELTLYENGERIPLRDVKLTGSRLEATKVLASGARVAFEATFGERRVNGEGSFGLLVEGDVRIDDDVLLDQLFYPRKVMTPRTAP